MPRSIILQRIKHTVSDKNNLFLLLLLLTPFIYVESLFDTVDLPRFAYVSLIAAVWLTVWLIQSHNHKIAINWNPLFLIILFLLFFSFISYLWGKENMLYQAELYFYTSLVIICFLGMQVNPETIHKFSSIAAITATVCAIIGVLQNFNINPLDYKQIAPPAATFINKNFAANFFDLILPVTVTLFLLSKDKKDAWIAAFAIAMVASYLVLTKSRGAYLSTFVTLTILLLSIQLFPWLKKQAALISSLYKKQIIIIIFIPFLFSSLPNKTFQADFDENRFSNYFSGNTQNSITARFSANQNSLDLFKEHLVLGVGLGGFQQNFRPYLQSILAKNKIFMDFRYLHNDPLQLFIELGIIGGAAALLFFILLFRFSFLSLKYEPEIKSDININRTKTLYLGFVIAIAASLSHSLFSFPYHQATSATFMALWIGFLLNFSARKILLINSPKLKIVNILAFTTSLIFLAGISHFYYKYIKSSVYMQQSVTAKDCDKASELAILSINTYAKDYLSQSQGINIIASCPLETKTQLLFAENILKTNPSHPHALYLAGLSYFKLGDYDLSYKVLKSLSFLYPYFSNTYTLIGHIAVKNKDYLTAKSYYEHALKLTPKNDEAKNMLKQLSDKGY